MNRVREYNEAAAELFPDIDTGEAIESVAPMLEASLGRHDADVIELERVGGLQYYQLTTNQFTNTISGLGTALTLTDITEREQYRTELERQNERLDMFAKTVSHDLRNPLNVAVGRLDMARQEADSEHLQAIDNALTRMEELITDVLALAKQGEDIAEMESVTLANSVNQAWAVVETEDATVELEDDIQFQADSDRLEQVFENLFRNAIDHCSPNVTIRVGTLEDDTGFYVEDDGAGIPKSEREQVFEFGHSTDAAGTGFGLAIVKEIVTAHDWTIAVTESSNGGARFEITIPDGTS
jgi:signal transduction histidine kinase